jgi:hypothetical protein
MIKLEELAALIASKVRTSTTVVIQLKNAAI